MSQDDTLRTGDTPQGMNSKEYQLREFWRISKAVDTLTNELKDRPRSDGRINNIIWAALCGIVLLTVTLAGIIYSTLDGNISSVDTEVQRRAFLIQENTSLNDSQARELTQLQKQIDDLQDDLRDLRRASQ